MKTETIIGIVGCVINVIGLLSIVVAIASLRHSKAEGVQKAEETELMRAPLLWGIEYLSTGHEKNQFLQGYDEEPKYRTFSLDRRTVLIQGEEEKGISKYSLFLNAL